MRDECGQAGAEYLGALALVTAIVVALLIGGIGLRMATGIRTAICQIVDLACEGAFSGDPADVLDWGEHLSMVDLHLAQSMDEFLEAKRSADRDDRLNWTDDGCSSVPESAVFFDFGDACERHDFGYRNYKELGIFPERKAEVDDLFLDDMRDHCASRGFLLQPNCYAAASAYHEGVKHLACRGFPDVRRDLEDC